jgi:mRNA interferase MazF
MLSQGDIVLLPVPFTDLTSDKQRPVIVISNGAYLRRTTDLVVVAMTSNPIMNDYSFVITSADLEQGRLNRPGIVRADKIYTLAQSLVVKIFGRVNKTVLDRVRQLLGELIAEKQ